MCPSLKVVDELVEFELCPATEGLHIEQHGASLTTVIRELTVPTNRTRSDSVEPIAFTLRNSA
jgi:hypothetical protein